MSGEIKGGKKLREYFECKRRLNHSKQRTKI